MAIVLRNNQVWESRPQNTRGMRDGHAKKLLEIRHIRWTTHLPTYAQGSKQNLHTLLTRASIPLDILDSNENNLQHLALANFRLDVARLVQFYAPQLWGKQNKQKKTPLQKSCLRSDAALAVAVKTPLYKWNSNNRAYRKVPLSESTFRTECRARLGAYAHAYNARYSWFKLPQRAAEVRAYNEAFQALGWSDELLLATMDRVSLQVQRGWLGRSSLHDSLLKLKHQACTSPDIMHTLSLEHLPEADTSSAICYHAACEQEAARLGQRADALAAENVSLQQSNEQLSTQAACLEQALSQQDGRAVNGPVNYSALFVAAPAPEVANQDGAHREQVLQL